MTRRKWISLIMLVLLSLVGAGYLEYILIQHRGVYRVSKFVVYWSRKIVDTNSETGAYLLAWLVTGIVGTIAYNFRQRVRDVYGIIEVLIGFFATSGAIVSLGRSMDQPDVALLAQGLALSGGLYIVVRGIDNFMTGIRKPDTSKEKMAALEEKTKELEKRLALTENKLGTVQPTP